MGIILCLWQSLCKMPTDQSIAADRGMAVELKFSSPVLLTVPILGCLSMNRLVEPWGFEPQTSSMPLRNAKEWLL